MEATSGDIVIESLSDEAAFELRPKWQEEMLKDQAKDKGFQAERSASAKALRWGHKLLKEQKS